MKTENKVYCDLEGGDVNTVDCIKCRQGPLATCKYNLGIVTKHEPEIPYFIKDGVRYAINADELISFLIQEDKSLIIETNEAYPKFEEVKDVNIVKKALIRFIEHKEL